MAQLASELGGIDATFSHFLHFFHFPKQLKAKSSSMLSPLYTTQLGSELGWMPLPVGR